MKIELKHIAPYLPYGLTYLNILSNQIENLTIFGYQNFVNTNRKEVKYKPILRPLSDLVTEIEHNGERFVPIDFIENLQGQGLYYTLEYYQNSIKYLSYWIMQLLFEWHFDVFRLIEEGLAIDINTLK